MSGKYKIAIDAMGGDFAPQAAVEGAVLALDAVSSGLILVGDQAAVEKHLAGCRDPRIEILHTDEVVGMDEAAITPIRRKRKASIRLAGQQVRDGHAQAMVSMGNTGAAMIVAKMVIGTIEGVDRPALAQVMPSQTGYTLLLDVGANVDSKPEFMRQFAIMGHFFAQQVMGIDSPRIGLMSIGEEEGKGNDFTREVFKMMAGSEFNFIGNIEGGDVFRGTVDVAILDGFVGNVLLKASESLAEFITHILREEMSRTWRTKLGYLIARPAFDGLRRRIDYDEYGAAPLLGVNGGCFIGHGKSNAKAVKNAIIKAEQFCESDVHSRIHAEIARLHRYEEKLRGLKEEA